MPRPIPQPRSPIADARSGDAPRGREGRPRLVDEEPAEPPEPKARAGGEAGRAPAANDTAGERIPADLTDPTSTPRPSLRGRPQSPSLAPVSRDGERAAVKKPLLASEALIEDLAPIEPAKRTARLWCAGLAAGFFVLGGLAIGGFAPGGPSAAAPEIALGCIALVAAGARLSYQQRAAVMILLGLLSAAVGFGGPVFSEVDRGWGLFRTLAAIALPGALHFRARYRAYTKARWILGAAFAAALPFAVYSVARVAGPASELEALGAALGIVAIGAGLLGFMGSETTGGGVATALVVIVALATDMALSSLASPIAARSWMGVTHIVAAAVGFAGTSMVASLGCYQILASRFAADARRINLHAEPREVKPRQPSGSDWSTKD